MTHINSRRRSIRFTGKRVTISAATKSGTRTNTFTVSQIKGISNTAGFLGPGRLSFTVEGGTTQVVENPASGGDEVDMNTFCYSSLDARRIRKLVADIEKARGSA